MLKLISIDKHAPESIFTQKKIHLYSSLVFENILEVKEVAIIPVLTGGKFYNLECANY